MEVLGKVCGSNEGTLICIPGYHGIPGNEADIFAKEGTNGVPPYQTVGIPFVVGKEVIRGHLRQQHLNRWKTCKGYRQSETLRSDSLPSQIKRLQAMGRQKLQRLWGCQQATQPLMPTCLNSDSHRGRIADCAGTKRRKCTYRMSLSGTGMQKIQNFGSYILEAQGSRKHEGEWPNKPGSQHQA